MSKKLIVNTGSDSHKYALYSEGKEACRIHLEKEEGHYWANIVIAEKKEREKISFFQYEEPVALVLDFLLERKIVEDKKEITSVGIRIVAPGEYFLSHNNIDDEYFSKLLEAKGSAPLHIGPIVSEIEQIRKFLPEVRMVGISDSNFHKGLPEVVKRYAISESDSSDFGIYRYGYHGISVASIVHKLDKWLLKIPERVIVCHLGNGSSITALRGGKSVDTSMGFTPLEGLPMGSRVGNIDPGAVISLGQKKGFNYSELEKYFNTECGLLALSGKTKDVRELIDLEHASDQKAKLALDSFAYNTRKYIGAYMAVLGGLDLLVFTATIGERSSIMRERICDGLQRLGLELDRDKNSETISHDGFINNDPGSLQIAVITTDEMGQMVREMEKVQ